MRLFRDSPFELSFMPWAVRPPQQTLMLVVKATFTLEPGVCALADEQALVDGDVVRDEEGATSLRTASDYALLKPRGEWYLAGSAYAPGGKPVEALAVRVRVGAVRTKEIVVRGEPDGRRVRPFTSAPLGWEHAWGGPRVTHNPAGTSTPRVVGRDGREDRTVGMFPIAGTWPARARHTGTYDARWKTERWPWLPEDFDFRFFQVAPEDQRLAEGYFGADASLDLVGLHAEHASLRTRLPGLTPRVLVERVEGAVLPELALPPSPRHARSELAEPDDRSARERLAAGGPPRLEAVRLVLDTVVIDSDAGTVQCAWRGLCDVADDDLSDIARIFYTHDEPDAPREHAALEHRLAELIADDLLEDEAMEAITPPEWRDPPALPSPDAPPEPKTPREFLQAALELIGEAVPGAEVPSARQVRARFAEAGLEPPELVEPSEPVPEPDDVDCPSLLRLALIVRRRLGRPFTGMDLTEAPLRGLNLSGVDLSGATLVRADLTGADLRGVRLDGALLRDASLADAKLDGASLLGADLSGVRAPRCTIERASLDGAVASGADLQGARLNASSFVEAELERADLRGASLRECRLDGADLAYAHLDEADLSRSTMVDGSLEGVVARGANLGACRLDSLRASEGADFTGARFDLSSMKGAQMQQALLTDARFVGCDLSEADLAEARGPRADFLGANLMGACLDRAQLPEARFARANLFEARLEAADLRGADLRDAQLVAAQLWKTRLEATQRDGARLDRTLRDTEAA